MNLTHFLLTSRGLVNLIPRAFTLLNRFDLTTEKIGRCLQAYVQVMEPFHVHPSLPITASALKRHPVLIRKLSEQGVEFAVHGYVHTDYTQLSLEEQEKHLEQATGIFRRCGIPFEGFRSPYLRWNEDTLKAVSKHGFLYDSNQVMLWDVVDRDRFTQRQWDAYQKVIRLYSPKRASAVLVLPRFKHNFVEIPVSIPDDEALVDRLGIRDGRQIAEIWLKILHRSYERGELFTLQLHHERVPICRLALQSVLREARSLRAGGVDRAVAGYSQMVEGESPFFRSGDPGRGYLRSSRGGRFGAGYDVGEERGGGGAHSGVGWTVSEGHGPAFSGSESASACDRGLPGCL